MITTLLFKPLSGRPSPRAVLVEWLAKEGDPVEAGSEICRYEMDKAVVACRAETGGHMRRILAAPGRRLSPGDPLAILSSAPDEAVPAMVAPGREEAEDAFDWSEIDERAGPPEPLEGTRRTIAGRMAMSKRFIPCFYLTTTVDMSGCLALRADLKEKGEKATFNDMAVKAAALALVAHPKVAGVFTPEGVVPRRSMNIGFAAELPDDGLAVPVVKDADSKPLTAIAAETRELAAKAKRGELTPEDCSGGVFSVSYLGAYEVSEFIAIVNPGEAAILAAGKVIDTPVAVDGAVAIRPVMKITLSFDHRSIDGALGARFAGEVKRLLENPAILQ